MLRRVLTAGLVGLILASAAQAQTYNPGWNPYNGAGYYDYSSGQVYPTNGYYNPMQQYTTPSAGYYNNNTNPYYPATNQGYYYPPVTTTPTTGPAYYLPGVNYYPNPILYPSNLYRRLR